MKGAEPLGAGKSALRSMPNSTFWRSKLEAKVALQMGTHQILPAVMTYLGDLANSLNHQETLASPLDKALAGKKFSGLSQELMPGLRGPRERDRLFSPHGGFKAHMGIYCAKHPSAPDGHPPDICRGQLGRPLV